MKLRLCILIFACVVSTHSLPHPFPPNIAEGRPVSVSCRNQSCWNQQQVPALIADGDNGTYWSSPPLSEIEQAQISIGLVQEFALFEVSVSFPSLLPAKWSVELSSDNSTFRQVRYFSTNCSAYDPCTQIDSSEGPVRIRIQLNTSMDTRAQFVRINLFSLQTQGQDPTNLFYTVSEVELLGACSCNGFASACYLDPDTMDTYRCRCQENTCGRYCESCCEGFQLLEYSSRREDPTFKCKVCDNCTISLIRELDTQTANFNSTADEFYSLILTIPSLLPQLSSLETNFSSLRSASSLYLAVTSSQELAVYGSSANYSQTVDVLELACAAQTNSSVAVMLYQLSRLSYMAGNTVSRLSAAADNLTAMLSTHEQRIQNISLTVDTANSSLHEYYIELYNSLASLQELEDEVDLRLSQAKLNLSTVISNHKYINRTLKETFILSSRVSTWYIIITDLVSDLNQYESLAVEIEATLLTLSSSLYRQQQIANTSLVLYQQLVGDGDSIRELFSNTTTLYANITRLGSDIESLLSEIRSFLERIRVITVSVESCLVMLERETLELSVRNVELSQNNSEIEDELNTFLNTTSVLPADSYTLTAETYTLLLTQLSSEIVSLIRTVPFTSIVLPLTEQELRYAIANASILVSLRAEISELIQIIGRDGIFSDIRSLFILNENLNSTADQLIREAVSVLNRVWPYNGLANGVSATLQELSDRVSALLSSASLQYQDGEYTTVLSEVRSALVANRTELSGQEAGVNSTLSEVETALTLIPNITLHNNASIQLRDTILSQLSNAEQRNLTIGAALETLRTNTSSIKSRNRNLLARLERVYSRLNRVHTKLQLPKAPLRLDGTMVVSLQPPPTEQLENASYSSDYSFYFEPVKQVFSDSAASSFLFFYAGPAIHENSTDTSALSGDFLAIISERNAMGFRARVGGTEFSGDLNAIISSNAKYRVRIKRVGSAFRFDLRSSTNVYAISPTVSSESINKFLFRTTEHTAYFVGGSPEGVLIVESLQNLDKFRGCVYLALTLRSNLYSLWDTRYHPNNNNGFLTDQTGIDCVRHSETQADFDVDGLSFNGYGHAYVPYFTLTPIILFRITPQQPNGLILTAFGTNRFQQDFIFSLYLRDYIFSFDFRIDNGERRTFTGEIPAKMSTQYSIEMTVTESLSIDIAPTTATGDSQSITSDVPQLYNADVLLFGGISQLAVDESARLANWTTSYYTNYTGCITNIILLRTEITSRLVSPLFSLNSKGSTGVSLGCPIVAIPEYSVTKSSFTGYINFKVLNHEGQTPTNYELLPTALGSFGTTPIDFTVPYSISLIVSKPSFIGSKAVLVYIKDSGQSLEISIDTSLNVTLEVSRNGETSSASSALSLSRDVRMHVVTVHTLGSNLGLNLFVDNNPPVSIPGDFDLTVPRELSLEHELFIGGNSDPDHTFVGCLKEVALHDSLLNLGIGEFVPTGSSLPGSPGVVHDMCGSHPYTGLVYGGAGILVQPFNYTEAVSRSVG